MASRQLVFPIALEQNKNDESTAYGKYFGKTYSPSEALNLKGLVQRVAMDQSVITTEIAAGVIDRLTVTMVELLQSGQSIKWDSLGTFRPTVESAGVAAPADYNVNTDVKGIHIRFIPENAKGEEITSRMMADMCTLSVVGLWETQKKTIDGKVKYVRSFTPIESFRAKNASGTNNVRPVAVKVYYTSGYKFGRAVYTDLTYSDGKYVLPAGVTSLYVKVAGLNIAGTWTFTCGSQSKTANVIEKAAEMPSETYGLTFDASQFATGENAITVTPPDGEATAFITISK